MERATISQLKNALSAYLDKVRAGETVLVCDRDQPIARIERVRGEASPDDRLANLERAGLLRRSGKRPPLEALRAAAPKPRQSVLQALLEERAEGR
jgi:antitoxin (DNA-binding transcriptional repressor) of toxin-antitoxin stability system